MPSCRVPPLFKQVLEALIKCITRGYKCNQKRIVYEVERGLKKQKVCFKHQKVLKKVLRVFQDCVKTGVFKKVASGEYRFTFDYKSLAKKDKCMIKTKKKKRKKKKKPCPPKKGACGQKRKRVKKEKKKKCACGKDEAENKDDGDEKDGKDDGDEKNGEDGKEDEDGDNGEDGEGCKNTDAQADKTTRKKIRFREVISVRQQSSSATDHSKKRKPSKTTEERMDAVEYMDQDQTQEEVRNNTKGRSIDGVTIEHCNKHGKVIWDHRLHSRGKPQQQEKLTVKTKRTAGGICKYSRPKTTRPTRQKQQQEPKSRVPEPSDPEKDRLMAPEGSESKEEYCKCGKPGTEDKQVEQRRTQPDRKAKHKHNNSYY